MDDKFIYIPNDENQITTSIDYNYWFYCSNKNKDDNIHKSEALKR